MERVLGSQGRRVCLKIDGELLKLIVIKRVIVADGVNKSNHAIQNPLLLVAEP
jgi:hypothetical protein